MEPMDCASSKQRILEVAAEMFSQKGFAATRVDKIAKRAGVNKALIYYYFPSKEAILDYLIDIFFEGWAHNETTYMQSIYLRFMDDGRMTLSQNQIVFASEEDLCAYLNATREYITSLLTWFLSQRQILRIILSESLSDGKHEGELFRYYDIMVNKKTKATAEKAPDIKPSDDIVFNKFFFGMMPLINFSVYSESYAAISGQSAESLMGFFMDGLLNKMLRVKDGRTLIIQTDVVI
jgi:AcrR family transcriptional regulator